MSDRSGRALRSRIFTRKTVETVQAEALSQGLKRSLSATNLVFLGVGCILGAGIFVMTGTAAANFAGPGVVLSFMIAGLACALTGLCYAELASTMPVSGSSYTYCYATIGEIAAWALGWLLLLEYGLAAAALAVGFSGYLTSLLADFGILVPAFIATPTVQSVITPGGTDFIYGGGVNLIAAATIAIVTVILVIGIRESAQANNVMVVIKILVLIAFIIVGVSAVAPENWQPFIPENEGEFTYGWAGVFRAASVLFFAYIGFETVSTAAAEARKPQRDVPIGILGALIVCTTVYIAVSLVLTGIVPFRELNVPDPIALAVDRMAMPEFAVVVKFGALMGLGSVLLVNAYGQSRVSFAMSKDGLLPPLFSALHPKYVTPWLGTITYGVISAAGAALLPITLLADLISLGIASAFSIVCFSLMWLRSKRPDLARPFKVPFGGFMVGKVWIGYIPVAAILLCWLMIVPVLMDIVGQALRGDIIPAVILGSYAVAGLVLYFTYGVRHARAGREDTAPCPEIGKSQG